MNEQEKLRFYVARVDEMAKRPLLKDGFRADLTLHFEHMKPLLIFGTEVNEDALRSFLMDFRQFFLEGEPVYVQHIFSICMRRLHFGQLREWLSEARRQWKGAMKFGPFELVIKSSKLTPENAVDLMLNGYYFHNDEEKRRELESLPALAKPLTRHMFLDYIIVASKYVYYMRNIIVIAFRDHHFSWP